MVGDALGDGGQGTVFEGAYANQQAAIKIFYADQLLDRRRFDREIEILPKVTNDHLVRVFDATTIDVNGEEWGVIAYELHKGGNIAAMVEDAGATPVQEIAKIGLNLCDAIYCLWEHRIVHRDVKPQNIVKSSDGNRYILVDLGLARHLDRSDITPVGEWVIGTPGYMAPEQVRGIKNLTCRADIYAIGVTLFEVATKQKPFRGRYDVTIPVHQRLRKHRPDLPVALVNVITNMMSARPFRRPSPEVAREVFRHHI